jgi:hypothetical protein
MENLSFEFRLIIVLCAAALLIMVGVLLFFRRKINALKAELAETAKGCVLHEAIVDSVPEEKTPVIIFRNAADNATIIHKYKGFGLRKYEKGEKLQVFYNETSDFFMIADDNEIFKRMFDAARWSIIATLTVPILLMGTVILITVF